MDNDYAESWQPSFVDGGSPGELTRSNSPPVISLFISARSGDAPLLVNFDATLSFDPDDDPFTVSWDFGDGVHRHHHRRCDRPGATAADPGPIEIPDRVDFR